MNYACILIKGPLLPLSVRAPMKSQGRAKGGRKGECREQVGPVFLYKEDVWAVTHLLTCLGGAPAVLT